MKLVGMQLTKLHLRVDTDDEDFLIEFLIESASYAVTDYIRDSKPSFLDEDGEPLNVDSSGVALDIPANVINATLILIGYLYKDRDNNGLYKANSGGNFEHGYLPRPVITLLYRYRQPGLR